MSKNFGNPGNFALAESRRKLNRFLFCAIFGMLGVGYVCGLQTGLAFSRKPISVVVFILILILIASVYYTRRYMKRFLDKLSEEAVSYRKGADGEALIADDLSDLPDTYSVFHDLTHPSIGGNIDHVVVGPTGVFALETKNWKGLVTLSGQGTLTVDGKHDHTKDGKVILGRALNLKKKIEALSNISTFVQAVMVFPIASVSVEQGTRCNLDVQSRKTLEDYLKRSSNSSRTLTPQQIATITRDLNALFKPAAQ